MKELFHNEAINAFRDVVYSNVYRVSDIVSHEKRIKDKSGDTEVYYDGFEIKDKNTKKTLFLPSKYVSVMPIKVTKTQKVTYSNKIFHVIENPINLQPQPINDIGIAKFFDDWFALKHTNEDHKTNGKFIVLANILTQSTARIVTRQAFGKDGIINSIINIADCGKKVNTVSPAKFAQLMEYPYTCFNEISGFGGEKKDIIERLLIQVSDGNPVYQHETTGSDKTKSEYNIVGYGATICHNIPSYYYTKGKECFEQMFGDQLIYRVMPFLLEGAIDKTCPIVNLNTNFKDLVENNMDYYRKWLGQFHWLQQNIRSQYLEYDISRYDLSVNKKETDVRWVNSFKKIGIVVQMYVRDKYSSKEEQDKAFYERMDSLYDAHKKYMQLLIAEGLNG